MESLKKLKNKIKIHRKNNYPYYNAIDYSDMFSSSFFTKYSTRGFFASLSGDTIYDYKKLIYYYELVRPVSSLTNKNRGHY